MDGFSLHICLIPSTTTSVEGSGTTPSYICISLFNSKMFIRYDIALLSTKNLSHTIKIA